jgi:hypothetical protein
VEQRYDCLFSLFISRTNFFLTWQTQRFHF